MSSARSKKEKKMRILWAVDAFEEKGQVRTHLVEALRRIAADRPVEIEPVYVLSPDELDLTVDLAAPWVRQFRPAVEKAIANIIKGVELPGLLPPQILIQKKSSLTNAVRTLTRYAKSSGAELIAIGTHGRKGLERVFMGSFAESTLMTSKVPVLVVGPETKVGELDHILFATDFSQRSSAIFDRVIRLCKVLGAKLSVFHSIPHPLEPVFESGMFLLGGSWVPVPEFLSAREGWSRKRLNQWEARARKAGVETESIVDCTPGGVSDSIVRESRARKAGIVAMAAQTGPLASALVGSITRQVVRKAPCPVWVIRA